MERAQRAAVADDGGGTARRVADERRWRTASYAVMALAAILFFARLGVRALWASEFRWAEIAREMLLTHDYFWPTINGHVYYDKPLGSYWLVVAATWLTGGMNEAAARLPSAVAGLLAVGLLILLGRRLYDPRTAVVAAFILATSFSFVFFSRHADADVETITGELAALLLFWRNQDRDPGSWTIGLWSLMAVTSLTKGLLGFVLPLLVIGVYASVADGWSALGRDLLQGSLIRRANRLIERNRWFFNWYTPLAIGAAAVIYYWPFAVSHLRTGSTKGLAMVYRENVERYFEPFDHVGPIYLYIYVVFGLLAPWSVFLPAAIAHAHVARPSHAARNDRFVLTFFWTTFIFFTLSGSRRSYYLLPILPAAALILARMFTAPAGSLSGLTRLLLKGGFAVLVTGVAVSTLAFLSPRFFLPSPWGLLPAAPDRAILAIYWIGSALAIGYAVPRLDPEHIYRACATIAWLFMFYLFVFAMPAGDAWRGEKNFAQQVRALIDGQSAALAFYRNGGPVYYLDLPNPVASFNARRQLDAAVDAGRTRWVVMRQRDVADLGLAASVVAREAVYPWDSPDHRLNAMVLVRMGPAAAR